MLSTSDWYESAACRGKGLPQPGRAQPIEMVPDNPAGVEVLIAKGQCVTCPVRRKCGDLAMADPAIKGVWGGLSDVERERIRFGHQVACCAVCRYDFVGPADEAMCDSCAAYLIEDALYQRVEARAAEVRRLVVGIRQRARRVAFRLALDPKALDRWCWDHLTPKQYDATMSPTRDELSRQRKPPLSPCGTEAAKTRHRRELRKLGKPPVLDNLSCACRTNPGANGWRLEQTIAADGTVTSGFVRSNTKNRKKTETHAGKPGKGMAA